MKKISKKVVFFGSGPVAEASLRSLAEHFEVEAIFTKPSTRQVMSAVVPDAKLFACETKHELSDSMSKNQFTSKVGVIVDFGIIVDQSVIDAFELGIINSHFSLLPEWRGADPITFAILSGQQKTGVSLMKIVPALDEGDLLAQEDLSIANDETTQSLTAKLIVLSNRMLKAYLPKYMDGKLGHYKQPDKEPATYSRKLTKDDGVIDWRKPAIELEREIRAFLGWPGSKATIAGKDVQLTKVRVVPSSGTAGEIQATKKQLVVVCGTDGLLIEQLKPAGKSEMDISSFLAGHYQYL